MASKALPDLPSFCLCPPHHWPPRCPRVSPARRPSLTLFPWPSPFFPPHFLRKARAEWTFGTLLDNPIWSRYQPGQYVKCYVKTEVVGYREHLWVGLRTPKTTSLGTRIRTQSFNHSTLELGCTRVTLGALLAFRSIGHVLPLQPPGVGLAPISPPAGTSSDQDCAPDAHSAHLCPVSGPFCVWPVCDSRLTARSPLTNLSKD